MSLGSYGQRDLHEVYTTFHDASVKRRVLNGITRIYTSDWRSTIEGNTPLERFSRIKSVICSSPGDSERIELPFLNRRLGSLSPAETAAGENRTTKDKRHFANRRPVSRRL